MMYIGLGVVAVAAILYYKGYISLPGQHGSHARNAAAPVAQSLFAAESKPLFRAAVRAAMLEAQDLAADKIAEGLRSQVVDHLASPFSGAPGTPAAATPVPAEPKV